MVKCSALEIVGLSDVGFNAQHFPRGSVRCWVLKLNVGVSDMGLNAVHFECGSLRCRV